METQGKHGLELLVIQPTPFCNLDCEYCYLPDRQSKARMPPEILAQTFVRAFECSSSARGFTIVWHAGEPMALPVGFYREAFRLLETANDRCIPVSHSFQTNGTLVTPEWCELIRKEGLRIGVSIDGPAFLHDRRRKTRAGRGTHARVMEGIRLLQQAGIPFHVISVLTLESLDFPDELFDFYLEAGIRQIAFNVEEIEGPHRTSSLEGKEGEQRFREFLSRFFDLLKESGEQFFVREFDSALAAIQSGGFSDGLEQQTTPLSIISVDCLGNFSTFSPELLGLTHQNHGSFSFGNVMRDSFGSVFGNVAFQAASREIAEGVQRCQATCDYFAWCGGGAPVNKLFENGSFDSTETLFCRFSKKAVIDVVLDKLEATEPVA